MIYNINKARKNQVLISQLPDNLRHEYHIYCDEYSTEFQSSFLEELDKLKTKPLVQHRFWDCLTNYTAHHKCGEKVKQYLGDAILDYRLGCLYDKYDLDEKNLKRWSVDRLLDRMDEEIKKYGNFRMFYYLINKNVFQRECIINNYDYSPRKYLDLFDIPEEIKDEIWLKVQIDELPY